MTWILHRDVAKVNMLQLLAGTQPHDLRLVRVQPQSAGSHPLIDVMDAYWHADVNLAVIGVLVEVQTVTQDQSCLLYTSDAADE